MKKLKYIHTRKEKQPNTTLMMVIKPQEENKRGSKEKRMYRNKLKIIKKMAIGTYLLITALNVNGLNSPTKTHRLVIDTKIGPVHTLSPGCPRQHSCLQNIIVGGLLGCSPCGCKIHTQLK